MGKEDGREDSEILAAGVADATHVLFRKGPGPIFSNDGGKFQEVGGVCMHPVYAHAAIR